MAIEYKCDGCGKENCKLWRRYQTFLDHQKLFCVKCAIEDQKPNEKSIIVDNDGFILIDGEQKTGAIGWLVPAVPTIEGDTYWGYTSVPEDRVKWWRELPL